MSSNFFSKYNVDYNAAEEAGVPVDFGDGVIFTVRRSTCKKAIETYKRLMKPYAAWKDVPVEVSRKVAAQTAAEAIVVGWTGLPNPDGEGLLPYSREAADDIFQRFPDLVSDVMTAADSTESFTKDTIEAVRKNSKK